MAQIELSIVTPEGVKERRQVDELTAPSVSGEFGLLPEHLPLLAGLRTGLLKLKSGSTVEVFAVGPGYLRYQSEQAELITASFARASELQLEQVQAELESAEEAYRQLGAEATESEQLSLLGQLRWAAVRLELLGQVPPATPIVDNEGKLLGHENYALTLGDQVQSEESQAV